MRQDPRVDAYIARQAEFAKPILEHLRAAVHAAYPDIEEAIKWGMPAYVYKGKQLAQMAAFKAHATFGFWNSSLLGARTGREHDAMGQFGRLLRLEDLPDEQTIIELVKKAIELVDKGVKAPRTQRKPKPPAEAPDDLRAALDAKPAAAKHFDAFGPGAKREYVDWITEAKRAETRAKRVAQAVEWIAEGKKRNWKYEQC
jgi:uncharacterized protein YdeI (YjbR/CyaY-like superfamily)